MFTNRFFPPAVFLSLVLCASVAIAQEKKGGAEGPPPPEDVVLETADGVKLSAYFYCPEKKGKETVPIILLHMLKRSRNDYTGLAEHLRSLGHAVLVPDLRGHGDSTAKRGMRSPLNADTMPRNEFINMVGFDLPALKDFLIQKNNAEELNVEKLCLVGAEMGASVALNWTYLDWIRPPEGNKKQGQDVKALVLISPEWSTVGLSPRTALTGPRLTTMLYDPQLQKVFKEPEKRNFELPVELDFRKEVSVYVVTGKGNSKAVSEARRLHKMLKPFHPDPPAAREAEERDLFYQTLETSLQGTKMLGIKGLNLEQRIAWFIELRLVKRSFSWAPRKNPYD